MSNKTENLGWVVELNSEPGYGIEIVLEQLQLGTDSNDYLIIAGCKFFPPGVDWHIKLKQIINLYSK